MNILVTHASKMGGTQGLAEAIAAGLGEGAVVLPVDAIKRLDGYDAVVIGGGLYAGRWTGDGRRFVRRHAKELRERDVWFFSSGPLDDSAHEHPIDPTRSVRRMMEKVEAKGHVTFGGRLPADAKGSRHRPWPRSTTMTGATSTRPGPWARGRGEMSAESLPAARCEDEPWPTP